MKALLPALAVFVAAGVESSFLKSSGIAG